jgi:tetratricopeptide (TPR) repeat protein
MGSDWFRKTSWSIADQEDFHRRLARARESKRAQYAFIQGHTLMEQGTACYPAALSLFDMVIDRYPDSLHLASALTAKGTCLENMGNIEGALQYYAHAIERIRVKRGMATWAWLDFAWLVTRQKLSDRYETALRLLDEFGEREAAFPIFPIVTFRIYGSRALIFSVLGLSAPAAEAARLALSAADKPHPS